MIRKYFVAFLLCFGTLLLFGCEDNEMATETVITESTEEEIGATLYESDFGYVLEYDPEFFWVLTDENSDIFGLWSESSDENLFALVNIGRVSGYTVKEYTEEITNAVISGVWSVTEADFGTMDYKSTTILFDEDTEYGKVYHNIVLVKDGNSIIVLEAVTHDRMTTEEEELIREMLNTFRIK